MDGCEVWISRGLRESVLIGGAMRTIRIVVYAVVCLAVAAASVSVTLAVLEWATPTAYGGVNDGGKGIDFSGIKGKIKPKKARQAGGQWRVDSDMFWRSHKESQFATPGDHTVDFKPISGWDEPNPKIVTVVEGKTAKVKGKYKKN